MSSNGLEKYLNCAAIIAGSTIKANSSESPQNMLRLRLIAYHECLGGVASNQLESGKTLSELERLTGNAALEILELVQNALYLMHSDESEKPFLGTRDLAHIRTLLSVLFKWNSESLLNQLYRSWQSQSKLQSKQEDGIDIIDLTDRVSDEQSLFQTSRRLLALLMLDRQPVTPLAIVVSPILVDRHLADILKPSISIGWLPQALIQDLKADYSVVRAAVMRLMQIISPPLCISSLGTILATPTVPHVSRTASFLLSRQLLRPDGVKGLFGSVFGETGTELDLEPAAPLEKLEEVSRLLTTIPSGVKPQAYFDIIVPACLSLLKPPSSSTSGAKPPPAYVRAAAFVMSRLSTSTNEDSTGRGYMLDALHGSFKKHSNPSSTNSLPPITALEVLSTIIINTDPSPALVSELYSPIMQKVYTLGQHFNAVRAADLLHCQLCDGLLTTWAKISSLEESTAVLWSVIEGEGGSWRSSDEGQDFSWQTENLNSNLPSLSLFSNEEINAESSDMNLFDLNPSPSYFVGILKATGRSDLSSEIFIKLLNQYLEVQKEDTDPMKSLLTLQLILNMQSQLVEGENGIDILSDPDKILSFINHALAMDGSSVGDQFEDTIKGLTLRDLRIVPEDSPSQETDVDSGDSDDEGSPSDKEGHHDLPSDICTTALSLLLSVLEAHQQLNTESNATLNEIWLKLQRIKRTHIKQLRSIAQEAMLVLVSRLASTAPSSSTDSENRDTRSQAKQAAVVKYQKALKLLQDPILPVRAHGLTLLRELVAPPRLSTKPDENGQPLIDQALVPGIMSVFLQSLEAEDSYIFLNAVQGLAAMVDGFGKTVLNGIMDIYTKGILKPPVLTFTKSEVDVRLRIGEALTQVIRRCGEALSLYIDLLVRRLLAVVRERLAPTVIRISSLSILGQCAATDVRTLWPYSLELISAMIDLLQVETPKKHPPPSNDRDPKHADTSGTGSLDQNAATLDSHLPELRRAALYFLGISHRSFVQASADDVEAASRSLQHAPSIRVGNSSSSKATTENRFTYPRNLAERLKITLRYIQATEDDPVLRTMTFELVQEFESWQHVSVESNYS